MARGDDRRAIRVTRQESGGGTREAEKSALDKSITLLICTSVINVKFFTKSQFLDLHVELGGKAPSSVHSRSI